MSQITVHAHPEGFLVKVSENVPINGVDLGAVSSTVYDRIVVPLSLAKQEG